MKTQGVRFRSRKEKILPHLLGDQSGMALLITVMTISLIIALTVEFHRKTWQKFLVSNNYRVKNELEAISSSGVNIAIGLLQVDSAVNDFDSLLDGWATMDNEDFDGLFPRGNIEIEVVDLSGRLQLNKLVQSTEKGKGQKNDISAELQDILHNLLISEEFRLEEEEAENIVDALVDWLDEDDRESNFGAENSYYQSLKKSYSCRNGRMLYIEELLLVRGITPSLLYGDGEKGGLINYLTVYGDDGKINLNTAPTALVKSMIPNANKELIVRFDEFRREPENQGQLRDAGWYRNISGWPGDLVINDNIIDSKSNHFQIRAAGLFDTSVRSMLVDLERDTDGKTVLLRRSVE